MLNVNLENLLLVEKDIVQEEEKKDGIRDIFVIHPGNWRMSYII